MDNEEKDSVNENDDKAKKTGTLNLEDISISTLKDDLAKKETKANEGGAESQDSWFNFLAKHKTEEKNSDQKEPAQKPAENPEVTAPEDDEKIAEENRKDLAEIANQGINELKIEKDLEKPVETSIEPAKEAETEQEKEEESIFEKQLEAFKSIGAPKNLPISEDAADTPPEIPSTPGKPALVINNNSQTEEKGPQVPPLSSFITPKIEAETQNKLSEMLAGKDEAEKPDEVSAAAEDPSQAETETKAEETQSDSDESLPKIDLEEEEEEKKDPISIISGKSVGAEEQVETANEEASKNPFAARLGMRPGGDKSLLQSVESALNYSASPEYAEERKKMEDQIAESKNEAIGNLKPIKRGSDNKKWFIVGGGALAGVVVLIIIIALVMGGSSQQPANKNENQNTAVANKNDNAPIKPLNNNANKKPVVTMLKAEKMIPNTEEIKIADKMEISAYLSKMRTGGGVSKMTQLIFMDSNNSAASFKDLMNNTEISIPEKVIADPSKAPALLIADFFNGKPILGLIIKSQSDTITTLEKMKSWEATMTIDLSELWKGIIIDNPNAYFADSGMFKNGRFALIDKKSGLSLDYLVENGYILITCGRDSMTILKSKIISPDSPDSSTSETEASPMNTPPEPLKSNSNSNTPTKIESPPPGE